MNNADFIRNMDNWHLAEFIKAIADGETTITTCKDECENCDYSESYCTYQIGEWLLQEHKEKSNE